MRLSLKRAYLKAKDLFTKPNGNSFNGIFYAPADADHERVYLFQIPTEAEAKKSGRSGLRLMGGMGNEGEIKSFHILMRECLEEVIGDEATQKFYAKGSIKHLNEDQKRVIRILETALQRFEEKMTGGSEPLTGIFTKTFWPDRANSKQDHWHKERNNIVSIEVSRGDLYHLADVAKQTAQQEGNKEVKDIALLGESELITRLKAEKTMTYQNERIGLFRHLRSLVPQAMRGVPVLAPARP